MKISIITPTHDTKFLSELEDSILAQTHTDWEWIVLLNGDASYIPKDSRAKIFSLPFRSQSVGLLKKIACSYATGEVIVEADHDDILTVDCLAELGQAFMIPSVGFAYSDDAKLGRFTPYVGEGWKMRMHKHNEQSLPVMYGQPLTPGRFGYIWYAPDHVRAWRKSTYELIGGHDESLLACDDLDLMHKLYRVSEFAYIPKVLYIYRIHGENTWLRNNQYIQDKCVEIYKRDIFSLAVRFADINGLHKIDLCGGFGKPEGFTSIDLYNGDITADLNNGIPLKDNSVGVIRAFDALEHIKDQVKIMKEIHRVLAPGGILISQTPSTDGRGAWQDPTHVSFWNQNSFWYYTRPEQAQYIRFDTLFRECYLNTEFPNQYCRENNIPYVIAHLEKL